MAKTFAQRGAAAHRARIPVAHGETITFRRGQTTIVIEGASPSPNVVNVLNGDGLEIQVTVTDWWIPADKVLLDLNNPANNEPRAGDEITSESGLVFEAMRPSESTPAVTTVCMGLFYVVHSKQTGVA
jgi:hypothetical protein